MKEIVKLPHILNITRISKEQIDVGYPSTEYKNINCIYYFVFRNKVIKVGQSINVCSRFATYRSVSNGYPQYREGGTYKTIDKIYQIMDIGEVIKIYAWFINIKKQYELQGGRRIPIKPNIRVLEKQEKDKYQKTLLLS